MSRYNLTRLKRLTIIYRLIQVALLGLFMFMAYNFMQLFAKLGTPDYFFKALIISVIIQLVLLYPAWLLAGRDLEVEVEAGLSDATPEQLVKLRRKRLLGDLWKISALGFFIMFIIMAPDANKGRGASLFLAAAYFSFLLTTLTYLQCFNLRASRKRKELSA